ncbi:MAG: glycosyltransferase [Planctomycetes bacterium]|nr:glycosyltransferase [Planctomycetota bacterium]
MDALSIIVVPRALTETVDRFLPALREQLAQLNRPAELFCLENAGHPSPPSAIRRLHDQFPEVRLLSIDPPLGVSAAVGAALARASHDTLVCLDGSGHLPIAELPRLLSRLVRADTVFALPRCRGARRWRRSIERRWNALRHGCDLDRSIGWTWAARREALNHVSFVTRGIGDLARQIARHGFRLGQIHVDCAADVAPVDERAWRTCPLDASVTINCQEHLPQRPPARRVAA